MAMLRGPRLLWAFLLLAASHCAAGGDEPRDAQARNDAWTLRDVPRLIIDGDVLPDVTTVAIEPATPTIIARNGAHPTVPFRLIGTLRDGSQVQLPGARWSLEHAQLGTLAADGSFTANGVYAGVVEVRATVATTAGEAHATAQLTVRTEREVLGPDVPADAPSRFTAAPVTDATAAPVLSYPLNGAFVPNNVAAPDVQWSPIGQADDLFRVRVVASRSVLTGYVRHQGAGFRHGWLVDAQGWHGLAGSSGGQTVAVVVDRWDGARQRVVAGGIVRVRIARASIAGTIYYWDLGAGRIQRIDSDTAVREGFMPNPPARPSDGKRCVACHAVSRDGHQLSAELWDGGDFSTVFDLTRDLRGSPAPTVFPTNVVRYFFSSFSPDAQRLVINPSTALQLIDPRSGGAISSSGLPTTGAAHPEWSPDGSAIAYVNISGSTRAVDFTTGNLALLPRQGGDTFGPTRILHTGASLAGAAEGGSADAHPTWSPDSRWIAFGHGQHSRSAEEVSANVFVPRRAALYIVPRTGGSPVRLSNANGGPSGVEAYWPTFSPFVTNEVPGENYYWIVYFSRRPYGNAVAGTAGSSRRQLWVAAVRTDPQPGHEPSMVPYWLPGQDVRSQNMAAFWAPRACRTNGQTCTVSSECCSGTCLSDPQSPGRFTCQTPPPAMCRRDGESCSQGSDCCTGMQCLGRLCLRPPG